MCWSSQCSRPQCPLSQARAVLHAHRYSLDPLRRSGIKREPHIRSALVIQSPKHPPTGTKFEPEPLLVSGDAESRQYLEF